MILEMFLFVLSCLLTPTINENWKSPLSVLNYSVGAICSFGVGQIEYKSCSHCLFFPFDLKCKKLCYMHTARLWYRVSLILKEIIIIICVNYNKNEQEKTFDEFWCICFFFCMTEMILSQTLIADADSGYWHCSLANDSLW